MFLNLVNSVLTEILKKLSIEEVLSLKLLNKTSLKKINNNKYYWSSFNIYWNKKITNFSEFKKISLKYQNGEYFSSDFGLQCFIGKPNLRKINVTKNLIAIVNSKNIFMEKDKIYIPDYGSFLCYNFHIMTDYLVFVGEKIYIFGGKLIEYDIKIKYSVFHEVIYQNKNIVILRGENIPGHFTCDRDTIKYNDQTLEINYNVFNTGSCVYKKLKESRYILSEDKIYFDGFKIIAAEKIIFRKYLPPIIKIKDYFECLTFPVSREDFEKEIEKKIKFVLNKRSIIDYNNFLEYYKPFINIKPNLKTNEFYYSINRLFSLLNADPIVPNNVEEVIKKLNYIDEKINFINKYIDGASHFKTQKNNCKNFLKNYFKTHNVTNLAELIEIELCGTKYKTLCVDRFKHFYSKPLLVPENFGEIYNFLKFWKNNKVFKVPDRPETTEFKARLNEIIKKIESRFTDNFNGFLNDFLIKFKECLPENSAKLKKSLFDVNNLVVDFFPDLLNFYKTFEKQIEFMYIENQKILQEKEKNLFLGDLTVEFAKKLHPLSDDIENFYRLKEKYLEKSSRDLISEIELLDINSDLLFELFAELIDLKHDPCVQKFLNMYYSKYKYEILKSDLRDFFV